MAKTWKMRTVAPRRTLSVPAITAVKLTEAGSPESEYCIVADVSHWKVTAPSEVHN